MSNTSAVPSIIDALVALFQATLSVPVLDGPESTDSNPEQFVAVGWDAGVSAGDTAVQFTQSWVGIGGRRRDEEAQITCCIVAYDNTSNKASRDAAFALFATIETQLRAQPQQGTGVIWDEIAGGAYHPLSSDRGLGALIAFTVHAKSRI